MVVPWNNENCQRLQCRLIKSEWSSQQHCWRSARYYNQTGPITLFGDTACDEIVFWFFRPASSASYTWLMHEPTWVRCETLVWWCVPFPLSSLLIITIPYEDHEQLTFMTIHPNFKPLSALTKNNGKDQSASIDSSLEYAFTIITSFWTELRYGMPWFIQAIDGSASSSSPNQTFHSSGLVNS